MASCARWASCSSIALTISRLSLIHIFGWAQEHINAIVDAWYPGAEGGNAVAKLLFGEYSPAGRLPITFYHSTKDLPDFHDYSMKGRTYRYLTAEPLYPFGYGLSYTSFDYSDLKLSADQISDGASVTVTAKVRNSGSMDGDEVVELYLRDDEASVEVPHFSLCLSLIHI